MIRPLSCRCERLWFRSDDWLGHETSGSRRSCPGERVNLGLSTCTIGERTRQVASHFRWRTLVNFHPTCVAPRECDDNLKKREFRHDMDTEANMLNNISGKNGNDRHEYTFDRIA